jgi:hypothetical protein
LILSCSFVAAQEQQAEDSVTHINSARVDSLLQKYYLDGVKGFIEKLGMLSVRQKNLSIRRKDFNDRLMIKVQRSLILSKNDYSITMQYKLNPKLYLKGQSVRSIEGTKSSVNLVYKLEYE